MESTYNRPIRANDSCQSHLVGGSRLAPITPLLPEIAWKEFFYARDPPAARYAIVLCDHPMTFPSILFSRSEDRPAQETREAPPFFADLNLDQLVDAIIAGKQSYDLAPFFYAPLTAIDAIHYRQEVMDELGNEALMAAIHRFAEKMAQVHRHLTLVENLDHHYNQAGWFLEAVAGYGEAVRGLTEDMDRAQPQSRGLADFHRYLAAYAASKTFTALMTETEAIRDQLAAVRYCVRTKEETVWVSKCEPGPDYSVDVLKTFDRFKQGAAKDYTVRYRPRTGMNHIEAQIIDCVARFYPEIFARLDHFYAENRDFLDAGITAFDREIQFYVAYLTFLQSIKGAGLPFCLPEITTEKAIASAGSFDLALANKLTMQNQPVITNDFYMQGPERIFVVTGPNQGGKTTFARTFGQLHYLARLGCPVPGSQARLYLYDHLFTQFEKEEDIRTQRGKLADDLVRIHEILAQATPNSLVIMNEVFSSTTLQDAVFLSKEIIQKIEQRDLLCVFVTFMDELASISEKTVSMVSTVDPANPARRTYKIIRKPADGLAYALSIAEKHGLTYGQIKERIQP